MSMCNKLVIKGTLPNLNDYIEAERTNRYKAAAMKRQWEQVIIQAAKKQLRNFKYTKPLIMQYTWYEKNRKRDMDNICAFGMKVIQDSLVKACILRNDGWNDIAGFTHRFEVDKSNPRVEVVLQEGNDER